VAPAGWVIQRKRPTDTVTKGFCFRPTSAPAPPPGTPEGAAVTPQPRMPTHATLQEFTPAELAVDIRAPNRNQVNTIGWSFFNLKDKILDIRHRLEAGTLFPRGYFGFNPKAANPAERHDLRVQPMTIIESRPNKTKGKLASISIHLWRLSYFKVSTHHMALTTT